MIDDRGTDEPARREARARPRACEPRPDVLRPQLTERVAIRRGSLRPCAFRRSRGRRTDARNTRTNPSRVELKHTEAHGGDGGLSFATVGSAPQVKPSIADLLVEISRRTLDPVSADVDREVSDWVLREGPADRSQMLGARSKSVSPMPSSPTRRFSHARGVTILLAHELSSSVASTFTG